MPDAEYMKEYREANPQYVEDQKLRAKASRQADAWLRAQHYTAWMNKRDEILRRLKNAKG